MKNICKKVLMLVFVTIILGSGTASAENPPEEEWSVTFGGTADESAYAVQQTTDGGYILAGKTSSFGAGWDDAWLVKTDSSGNKVWDKTFGGMKTDIAHSVQQTTDGGYILAGETSSFGADSYHAWLVKTDSNGNTQWSKTFGEGEWDIAHLVQQTVDGGYIVAGQKGPRNTADVWIIKTDSKGNEQWAKTFGGDAEDIAKSIQQTPDGGYIVAGTTKSFPSIEEDFWLIKLDSEGSKQWDNIIRKTGTQIAESVAYTTDGGYIIVGDTTERWSRPSDFFVLKTDSEGTRQWDYTYSKKGSEEAESAQETADGGYIITGTTAIFYDGISSAMEPWVLKIDSKGLEQWNITIGSVKSESRGHAYSVQQTNDNGYIIAGDKRIGAPYNMLLIKLKGQNIVSPPSDEDDDSNNQENTNSLLFHTDDFKDFPSFVAKLKHSQDPLSRYLREHLSAGTRQLLQVYNDQGQPSEALQTALETELNQILQSDNLYDEQRFENVELSDEVLKLIEYNPQGQDLIELNRLLLEEAYPQEIEKYKVKESTHVPGFMGFGLIMSFLFIWCIRKFG